MLITEARDITNEIAVELPDLSDQMKQRILDLIRFSKVLTQNSDSNVHDDPRKAG